MVNLYQLYFQQNKKIFIPPLFYPLNQTQIREIKKKNSILLLFHHLSSWLKNSREEYFVIRLHYNLACVKW